MTDRPVKSMERPWLHRATAPSWIQSTAVLQWAQRLWTAHHSAVLTGAVVLMAIGAAVSLGRAFSQLTVGTERMDGVDVRYYYNWVANWFTGRPVYGVQAAYGIKPVPYLPASFAILWPLVGWMSFGAVRWMWALTSVLGLIWMIRMILEASGADTRVERVFVVLLPLVMNATAVTVHNGQLIVHVLPAVVAAVLLLQREDRTWTGDLAVAGLLLASLAKPNISVPFFWLLLFVPGGLRIGALVALGYVGLTYLAAAFQHASVVSLINSAVSSGLFQTQKEGYGNVPGLLSMFSLDDWMLPATAIALAGLGLWVRRHQHGDVWLILGVTAIVARLWTFHRSYDNFLILLPMIALFRTAKRGPLPYNLIAGGLLAGTIVSMSIPARQSWIEAPIQPVFASAHAIVWIVLLIFLADQIRRDRSAGHAQPGL